GVLLREVDDEVAGDPVGAGVGLVLVDDARVARRAALDLERHGVVLALDARAAARRALVADRLATAPAGVAAHLHLLVHAGRELLLDDADAVAAAHAAGLDLAVGGAAALARLAD